MAVHEENVQQQLLQYAAPEEWRQQQLAGE